MGASSNATGGRPRSAPLKQLVEKFGFTPDAVARIARERVGHARRS